MEEVQVPGDVSDKKALSSYGVHVRRETDSTKAEGGMKAEEEEHIAGLQSADAEMPWRRGMGGGTDVQKVERDEMWKGQRWSAG